MIFQFCLSLHGFGIEKILNLSCYITAYRLQFEKLILLFISYDSLNSSLFFESRFQVKPKKFSELHFKMNQIFPAVAMFWN